MAVERRFGGRKDLADEGGQIGIFIGLLVKKRVTDIEAMILRTRPHPVGRGRNPHRLRCGITSYMRHLRKDAETRSKDLARLTGLIERFELPGSPHNKDAIIYLTQRKL